MQPANRHSTLLQDLRALPGQYWILFSGTLVNRFGHFVIPFLAIYLRQQGHDPAKIGWVLGFYGAGALFAGLAGGYLADRIGRKPTMIISCVGTACLMLLLSQVRAIPLFLATSFATGLFTAMYHPASSALIADLIPPHLRVRAFACQRFAVNLGFAAGMATAGFMAKHSFLALFIVDAATTLVLGAAVFFGLKPRPSPTLANSGWSHAFRHMKTNTPFQFAVGASFLIAVVFWQMSSSYGLQTTEGARLDESVYGLLMALNGVMIVLLELPLTGFTRRFSPVRVMAVGYAITGIGMGINAFGASLPLLVASMVVFTFGEMISLPVANSHLAGFAPEAMRGRYQGMISIAWSAATLTGPAFGLSLYGISPAALWIVMAAFGFASAGLILSSTRKPRSHPSAIPQSNP